MRARLASGERPHDRCEVSSMSRLSEILLPAMKPCPFCASILLELGEADHPRACVAVSCKSCLAEGPTSKRTKRSRVNRKVRRTAVDPRAQLGIKKPIALDVLRSKLGTSASSWWNSHMHIEVRGRKYLVFVAELPDGDVRMRRRGRGCERL